MATRTVTTLPVTEKTVGPLYDSTTGQGNWDASRAPIDRVIIHTMVGTASAADSRFNNPSSNVSAHYGILETGEIWHWVDETNTAYHAGDYAMNQRSIGIEHEDNGDYNGIRPDTLYTASAQLVKDICTFYNIPIDRDHIKKHSEVSDAPTGCPDALDIDRIVREASGQTGNYYKGIDLTNTDSVKVCVDTWYAVSQGQYVPLDVINAFCTTLGIPTGSSKDAINAAIVQLQNDKASAETTVTNLNKQIPDLEGQIKTLTNQVTDLTQKAQNSDGILYKDLYNQAESDLLDQKTALGKLQETYNRAMAQYTNTSYMAIDKWQLARIAIARLLGLQLPNVRKTN